MSDNEAKTFAELAAAEVDPVTTEQPKTEEGTTKEVQSGEEGTAQPGAQTEEAPAPAKSKGYVPVAVLEKRIIQKNAQQAKLQEENETLKALLASLSKDGEGEQKAQPEKQATVDPEAYYMARRAQEQFIERCNTVFVSGKGVHEDFGDALGNFSAVGGLPDEFLSDMFDVLDEVGAADKAADVLYSLANDIEEADRVMNLPANKRAIALVKLASASKPKEEPRTVTKPATKAPAPIETIETGTGVADADPSKISFADLAARLGGR